jgi:hypothetical protein
MRVSKPVRRYDNYTRDRKKRKITKKTQKKTFSYLHRVFLWRETRKQQQQQQQQ